MSTAPPGELTRLLRAHREGDRAAFDELVGRVHDELRKMARQQLRKAPAGATLDTVALINEAWMKLADESGIDWQSRAHFYAVTARAMRFVVVDHARRASADKRGSGETLLPLDDELGPLQMADRSQPAAPELVLAVHAAIDQLATFNERLARIVECRFFAGMNDGELAEALGVTPRTVQRDWLRAKAWLQRALESPTAG
jgi:RNA polymerase sigma factor (TIGR02999 family)